MLLRGLLDPAGHVAWTGVVCAALWNLIRPGHKIRRVLLLIGAYLGAVLLHAAWDGSNNFFVHVFVGVVSFGSLLVTIFWTDRRRAAAAPTPVLPPTAS